MRIEEVRLNKAMEEWCCRVEMKEREVITGTIRILIERKQLIKAVPFICNFKQNDEFPLVPLLREYVQKESCTEIFSKDISHDEKEKVVDDRIAALRALIQCIEDYGFESHYPPTNIMMEIEWLGELKENPNLVLSSVQC